MEKPFSEYQLQVDQETDEVYVEAWDEEAPQDIFRARFTLTELEPLLRKIHRALRRS